MSVIDVGDLYTASVLLARERGGYIPLSARRRSLERSEIVG